MRFLAIGIALTALISSKPAIASQVAAEKQAAQIAALGRYVAETYLSLRYLSPTPSRCQTISQDLDRNITQWFKSNPDAAQRFADEDASQFEEATKGFVQICSDFASQELVHEMARADYSAGKLTGEEFGSKMLFPAERVRRIASGYAVWQKLYRKHASLQVQAKLSPVTYYMLNGALLVSPAKGDFDHRFMAPDIGLSTTATIGNHVLTVEDADKVTKALENSKDSKSLSSIMLPYSFYCSIKPGDQVLGLRAKGTLDWTRVKDWREVAKAASALGSSENRTIEVLIGRESNATRVFELLSW